MKISLRAIETTAEYHACEELQGRVWNMPNELDVVPLHLLLSMQRNGGLLLGAFHDDRLVGFVLGYPGVTADGTPKHCSHMMGILAEYRSQGLGYRLKVAQRQYAQAQGHELMTWTYDPLESRNAGLNVHKLGALCDTYIRDYYGPMTDGLNAGLPSDRFEVEWWITSERVIRRLDGKVSPPPLHPDAAVANTTHEGAGFRVPSLVNLNLHEPEILVEIPADYQAIKIGAPTLAMEWRQTTRKLFEAYFSAGYHLAEFQSRLQRGDRRSFYLLRRGSVRPASWDVCGPGQAGPAGMAAV